MDLRKCLKELAGASNCTFLFLFSRITREHESKFFDIIKEKAQIKKIEIYNMTYKIKLKLTSIVA